MTLCCLRLSWPPSSRRGSERARPHSWPLLKTHLVAGCADGLPSTHRQYPRWQVGTLGELYLLFIYLRVRHVSLNQGEYSTTGNSLPQSSIPQLVTPPPKPPPTPVFTNLQQLTSPLWLGCQASFEKGKKNK